MNLIQKQMPQSASNKSIQNNSVLPVSFRGMKNNFTFENVFGTLSSDKVGDESTKKTLQHTASASS